MNNAQHTLFVCARWGVTREAVGWAVATQLTPDTMVSLMLQSEQKWKLIESFVSLVMKKRELDGACGARRQQGPVEIASGPAPAGLGLEAYNFLKWFGTQEMDKFYIVAVIFYLPIECLLISVVLQVQF